MQITEDQCTGCGACYNKCPVKAIQMHENKEGFLFPYIAEDKCIECGQCLRTCPVNECEYKNSPTPECYAAWAEDSIRLDSSSGGLFSVAASYIIYHGGYVCGAAYSQDYKKVEHIIISDMNELPKLKGSKYVQSNIGETFCQIESLLKQDQYVLFSGCPCQVAGLYGYLGKKYDKLYTIDLVCHGVPSPKAFRKFIEQREKENGAIQYLSFRDKKHFGWSPSTVVQFENGSEYSKMRKDSSWMKSFLEFITLRKSCGQCIFAHIPRQGDLTLADFWNIDKFNPTFDDKKGTSMVLINNSHGGVFFSEIREGLTFCEKAPLEFAKKNNAQLHSSARLHPRRERFFHLLDLYDFDKAVDYGINRRFDIGYVGWWYGLNYGSALTNYALHETLISLGKTVLMLEWPLRAKPKGALPDTHTRRFAQRHYDISLRYTYDELDRMNYHCESFVLGSDQLWNYYSVKENGNYFFLDFVHPDKRKVAYATSFGHNRSFFPAERQIEIAKYLQQFTAISVREKDGINICRKTYGVDAVQALDPVFLCDVSSYDKVIKDADMQFESPYILAYILNPTEEKRAALLYASSQLKLPLKVILDGQESYEENRKAMNLDDSVLGTIGIEDWLYCFRNARFILTDSYHGMCFSIIFKKDFICFGNKKRGMSRFETLLSITKLNGRMINEILEKEINHLLNEHINYDNVNKRMQSEKEASLVWLKNALNSPLDRNKSLMEIIFEKQLALEAQIKNLKEELSNQGQNSNVTKREPNQKGNHLLKIWRRNTRR